MFTSVNGVAMVRRRVEATGQGRALLERSRLAAIGPATAAALRDWGLTAEVVPGEYVAEGLLDSLRPLLPPGDRVLLPRAAETRDVLVRELTALGARVDRGGRLPHARGDRAARRDCARRSRRAAWTW